MPFGSVPRVLQTLRRVSGFSLSGSQIGWRKKPKPKQTNILRGEAVKSYVIDHKERFMTNMTHLTLDIKSSAT